MTFPAYSAYKDSGVDWLGVVPKHWGVKPLRYLGRFRKGLTITKGDLTDGGIPCLNYGEVHSLYPFEVNQDVDPLRSVPAEYLETDPSACVKHGDFVFADTSEDLDGVGNFTHVSGMEPLFAGYHTIIYSINSEVSSRFLAYCLESFAFRTQLRMGVKGVKVFSITQEILRGGIAWLPIMAEQTQIARFLDHETARIDALIEEQQRLIELLKEKRQAVISHAVTKGLDPTVPMKDSGVEWLGKVPTHWRFGKIRYFAKIESGHTPSRSKPEYWENCTIPWFSLADVWQIRSGEMIELFQTKELVSELGLANSSARLLPKGTVILSRTASVGYSAIMGCDMATTQDFVNWICGDKLDNKFLLFCFRAMKSEFDRLMVGSTHKTIYMPDIAELVCSVPPLDEQEKIAAHIKISNSKFGSMIEEADRMMKLLSERRSALISAAVTGKIDVRSWQPPANPQSPAVAQDTV